jgi:hypothetical protein
VAAALLLFEVTTNAHARPHTLTLRTVQYPGHTLQVRRCLTLNVDLPAFSLTYSSILSLKEFISQNFNYLLPSQIR